MFGSNGIVYGTSRTTAPSKKAQNRENARRATLAANPGLGEAIQVEHRIINDIRGRFNVYGTLSPAQIALVFKIAKESKMPRAEEAHVAAPTGMTTFRGKIVSVKNHDSRWGTTMKMTVKVETPAGTWLAWGTCPNSLLDLAFNLKPEVAAREVLAGATVEVIATLEAGNDAHFVFMKRPQARVLALASTEPVQQHEATAREEAEKAEAVAAQEEAREAYKAALEEHNAGPVVPEQMDF